MLTTQGSNVSEAEVRRFDALAAQWWDPHGPMAPLHAMNPARVGWIDQRLRAAFGPKPIHVLDIGCGAGLLAEALARRGYEVTGIDPSAECIAAARAHADPALPLHYEVGEVADLIAQNRQFSVITALELIEHVPGQAAFVADLAQLLQPGGLLFMSTLNRTPAAYVTAKIGAEFVLRWLPVGTHDWRKFVTPSELAQWMRSAGLRLTDIAGLQPDLVRGGWRASRSLRVNYIAMSAK